MNPNEDLVDIEGRDPAPPHDGLQGLISRLTSAKIPFFEEAPFLVFKEYKSLSLDAKSMLVQTFYMMSYAGRFYKVGDYVSNVGFLVSFDIILVDGNKHINILVSNSEKLRSFGIDEFKELFDDKANAVTKRWIANSSVAEKTVQQVHDYHHANFNSEQDDKKNCEVISVDSDISSLCDDNSDGDSVTSSNSAIQKAKDAKATEETSLFNRYPSRKRISAAAWETVPSPKVIKITKKGRKPDKDTIKAAKVNEKQAKKEAKSILTKAKKESLKIEEDAKRLKAAFSFNQESLQKRELALQNEIEKLKAQAKEQQLSRDEEIKEMCRKNLEEQREQLILEEKKKKEKKKKDKKRRRLEESKNNLPAVSGPFSTIDSVLNSRGVNAVPTPSVCYPVDVPIGSCMGPQPMSTMCSYNNSVAMARDLITGFQHRLTERDLRDAWTLHDNLKVENFFLRQPGGKF